MKNLIAALTLCALVLTGCAASAGEPPSESDAALVIPAQRVDGLSQFRYIPTNAGAYSFNSSGFYEIRNTGYRGGFTVSYTDFATMTTRPLCALEGCSHEGEDCAAAHRSSADLALYAGDDRLFWFYDGPFSEGGAAGLAGELYVSELNGSNKRLLCEADDGFQMYPVMFYDGEYIYYIQNRYDSDSRDFAGELVRVDVASSARQTLLEREPETPDWYLTGVYENSLLVLCGRAAEYFGSSKKDPSAMEYSLISVPADGGEARTLGEWSVVYEPLGQLGKPSLGFRPEFAPRCCRDGAAYGVTLKDASLVALDLATWTVRELCERPAIFDDGYYEVSGVWDGRALLEGEQNGEAALCAYSLADGELAELTLTYYKSGRGLVPVTPYAEVGESFLVPVGERIAEITGVFEGAPVTESVSETQFALIAKENYWRSVPDYREMKEA